MSRGGAVDGGGSSGAGIGGVVGIRVRRGGVCYAERRGGEGRGGGMGEEGEEEGEKEKSKDCRCR